MNISELIKQGQDKSAMLTRSLKHQVDLYAEKTHFVFELLQNAEDAGATQVSFHQFSDRLEIQHDGKPFTESNVKSLCDAANSDKKDENGKIGKFGVGFKSVFSICDTVELYSEPDNLPFDGALPRFAIRIENYTDPNDINNSVTLKMPFTTKFVFPFSIGEYYNTLHELEKDVSNKLSGLGTSVLLFMKNIKYIQFSINSSGVVPDCSGTYMLERNNISDKCTKVTALGETNNKGVDESYLVFSKQIDGTERSVDIAFSIVEKQNKIEFTKSNQTYAFVYFPTETDSKLNFIVQAPFDLTPNRSSLKKDSNRNTNLIELLKGLLREAILEIRDQRWMTLDFVNLLPYNVTAGTEWAFFKLHTMTLDVIMKEQILPTIDGDYTDIKSGRIQRSAKLLDLFEREMLCEFLDDPMASWLPREFTENSPLKDLHRFLTKDLDVAEIGSTELPKLIRNNPQFFVNVTDDWLAAFYDYLTENAKSLLGKNGDLAFVPFVKTTNGEFAAPFQKRGKDIDATVFIRPPNANFKIDAFAFVDEFVEHNCKDFLRALGLTEPNGFDYFLQELTSLENSEEIDDEVNISLVKSALKYINEGNTKALEICKKSLWLMVNDSKGNVFVAHPGMEIYRCRDLNGVSLDDYFAGTDIDVYLLDESFYLDNGLSLSDLKIFERLGVRNSVYNNNGTSLEDGGGWYEGNAQCSNIGDFRKNLNFSHIESVLKSINNSTVTIARKQSAAIFALLKNIERNLSGKWKYGVTNPLYKDGMANIVVTLKNEYIDDRMNPSKWVFTNDGNLHNPDEIHRYELDNLLYGEVDENSKIYELLGFKKTEQDEQKELVGDLFKRFSKAEIDKLIQAIVPEDDADTFDPTVDAEYEGFPEEPIKNLLRLVEIVKQRYQNAPTVEYEQVLRRVRISRGKDKEHIRLRYRGYCQLCETPSPYWEVAEIFNIPNKELEYMNLSLCPSCASEYRRLRNDDLTMSRFKDELKNANLVGCTFVEFGEGKRIRFTKSHLAEIQETLKLQKNNIQHTEQSG